MGKKGEKKLEETSIEETVKTRGIREIISSAERDRPERISEPKTKRATLIYHHARTH